jgi:hypothetical protein
MRWPTINTDRVARARVLADAEWPDSGQPPASPAPPERSTANLRRLVELAPREGPDFDPDPHGMMRLNAQWADA